MGQQDIIDIIISDIRRLGVDFRAVDELDALAGTSKCYYINVFTPNAVNEQ